MKRLFPPHFWRRLQLFGHSLAMLLAAALFSGSLLAATHIVKFDGGFDPRDLGIEVGDTVQWVRKVNNGYMHSVKSRWGHAIESQPAYTFTFSHTFDTVGGSSYVCGVHQGQSTLRNQYVSGSIVVYPAGQAPIQINAGLNDAWRSPTTPGQGFFITVFPDIQKIFVGWFTYDIERPPADVTAILGDSGHRWLTAFGSYSGQYANIDIELTQGGIFDSAEPAPTQVPYGRLELNFSSCSEGEVSYELPYLGVSGKVPIERIANDSVPLCESLEAQLQQNP